MLARALWSLTVYLMLPLLFARLWWRGRVEPGYRLAWRERLGRGSAATPGSIWIHAVSLGETRAAATLVDALRVLRPEMRLLLTHGTATGREAGADLLRTGDQQRWLPYDTPGATRRFLARTRPAVGVLMETEIWPNLIQQATRLRIPMVVANARLSERSARQGRRFGSLLIPAVEQLLLVLAQTRDDAARLLEVGAREVEVCGNLKFDMAPAPAMVARGRLWRRQVARPVVMMASSRDGEEIVLLQAWADSTAPRPLLLLVPRHPQRFDEVADLVSDFGLTMARRTQWQQTPGAAQLAADVWLGDSLGEMPVYYGAADVALLGGSFAKLGGQNLIEAAACACPIVMGPHTFNFAQAADNALSERAAVRVHDITEGVQRAIELARDPQRELWARRALAFAQQHKGAARRMAEHVLRLVDASAGLH
jgi:3-deoxy-D-manno-octulosonic-acid transferase